MTGESRPPKHLQPATRRWWQAVVSAWELESHHIRLLTLAAQCWDETQAAQALVQREGLTVRMPSGAIRPHPALRIVQDGRICFARLLRELDLDVDAPKEAARPPALRSIVGGR